MSGFTFGTPANTTTPAPATGGFSFGAAKTSTAPNTFGLGAPAVTGGLTFGAPATAAAPTLGSISFGAAALPSSAAAPPPSFGFGAVATTTAPAAPTLGGGTSFTFGKPAATATPTLNFGTTTTSGTPFATGTGLFAKPAATTTATPTTFVGLGGIDVSGTQPKPGDSKQDIKVKETKVPDEIGNTVDALKTYIKAQKTVSSDISRSSTSKLSNVSNEIMNLQWSLTEISNAVETNYNQIKLMRRETSKTIQTVEMAQRTQDTPAGLQFENTAPFQYFQNLVYKYEQDLVNFRQQIALTEKHMQSLTNPQTVSPDDLKRGFRQINESFISLAGRLHEIHQKVEAQKEQFLNLRKYRLHDATNVFAKLDDPEAKEDVRQITCGPTPFSNISAMSSFGKSFGNTTTPGGSTVGQATQ